MIFYCGFVVVDQALEAFGNQFVQFDALGNERLKVDFAFFNQFDGFGVVVAVGDGAAHVQLFHHNAVDVDGSGVAPNGYDDDFCSRTAGFDHGVQHFVDAGAFECDVYAFAVGQFFHFF